MTKSTIWKRAAMRVRGKRAAQAECLRGLRTRALQLERLEDRRLLTGPYAPAAGQPGSTAIHKDDSAFVGWATGYENLVRGPQDINNPTGPAASYGSADDALGKAVGDSYDVVSLGDGGQVTLTFDRPIADGAGSDFAVFENGFSDTFLELGFVEVSSDGSHFFRFDAVSLTPASPQVGGFGALDTTNLHNFAGKYRQGYGTPFDLQELAQVSPLLDVNHVTHVRIVDVVGRVSAAPGNPSWSPSLDSLGNLVNDPYSTPFASSGFDLDAIGVLHYREHTVHFEDMTPDEPYTGPGGGAYWKGPDPNGVTQSGAYGDEVVVGAFESVGLRFNNIYSNTYGSWTGWAYSNTTDTTTEGYLNQFSAYTGVGAADSRTYAVSFRDVWGTYPPPTIARTADTAGMLFRSVTVTNTTYAALSMLNGDSFAKKFGGPSGDDPDWFLLTIEGKDDGGASLGTVEFYLADYRFAENSQDYIIDTWTTIDISSLQTAATLEFVVTSSDVGEWGMNTPAYFALDNVVLAVPSLTVSIAADSVPETAGAAATTATVTRTDADISEALTVMLSSSDTREATVASTVTIPAGQAFVTVDLDAVDDAIVDGAQTVTMTASAAGFTAGSDTLVVTDDDVPTLTVTVTPGSVSEADARPTAGFEDVGATLGEESYWNGSEGTGGFESGGLAFNNDYDANWGTWSGWSYSNTSDTTTPGYGNQYSAVTGEGALDSRTYAVAYASAYGTPPTVELTGATAGRSFQSLRVTNTTYAALSMREGDAFANKFGGVDGTDPDWFLLTITGWDGSGGSVGTVEFYLADYRSADPAGDYVVDTWTEVDVSSLVGAQQLKFSLSSSDVGPWGMNTPAYFAVDQIVLSGPSAVSGTVYRNDADLSGALVVTLSSNDGSEAWVPASVTIPAGQASVEFPIWSVDDAVVDGPQTVTVTASAVGYISGSDTLVVTDDDVPSLTVSIAVASVAEDAGASATTVTITRNTDLTDPLIVALTSSDTTEATVPSAATIPAGWFSITVNLDAVDDDLVDGTQTVTIGASAEGHLSGAAQVRVTDAHDTLIVTRFTPASTGFTAEFSRELDESVLNLYDGVGGSLGPADVVVRDGVGNPVAGSMVVDGTSRAIRFVKTGTPLEPGEYTVVLRSGDAAFRDRSGRVLDGDADWTPGSDFSESFTVLLPAQRLVSIPDFARGAGQAVNVPAAAAGLPVRLDDAAGVSAVTVDVTYDSSLLNVRGASLAAGMPGDWSVTLDITTPGAARIAAAGTTLLSGTNVEVVRLAAAVPGDAPYGASQAIRLENVLLNGGAILARGDVAVHKAAYLGDADGSGIHSAADAFLVVQAALGLAGGFAAHAWTDPRIVGDADGSGLLSAADAFLIVQEGLGLSEPFVPDNPHITVTPVGGAIDPQFQIDVSLVPSAAGWVSVPVKLAIESAATNVGGFDFDLFFDPTQLTIQVPDGVSAGADTAGWAMSLLLVAPGQLRVGMVSSTGQPLTPGLREIARLQFRVEASAGSAAFRRFGDDRLKPVLRTPVSERPGYVALDIEPVDLRAGGYTWTDADGSVLIRRAERELSAARRERVWRELDAKAELLEEWKRGQDPFFGPFPPFSPRDGS